MLTFELILAVIFGGVAGIFGMLIGFLNLYAKYTGEIIAKLDTLISRNNP